MIDQEEFKQVIKDQLPGLMRSDPAFRDYIVEVSRERFADKQETQDRFWEVMAELRRDREENQRKWESWERKWGAQRKEDAEKWEAWRKEDAEKWEAWRKEDAEKWEAWRKEDAEKWQAWLKEDAEKWERNEQRWRENQKALDKLSKRMDRGFGGLGARWGLKSEKAFRDALAGILEENFGVEVVNIVEYDDEGTVFGRPDQIELDIIIVNGVLLICELKSSMSRSELHAFLRKARFYEKRHDRKANRLIVISPMIHPGAEKLAKEEGVELYGDSEHVEQI